jgi:predicted anti-sigma-YlaC factor YlaD
MHAQYTSLMSLALDSEATVEQEANLRQHIEVCGSCAATWREWKALDRRLLMIPTVATPPDLLANILVRLDGRHPRPAYKKRWLASGVLLAWAVAACIFWAALIGGALWVYRNPVASSLLVSSVGQALSNLVGMLSVGEAYSGEFRLVALPLSLIFGLTGASMLGFLWLSLLVRTGMLRQSAGVQWEQRS